MLTRISVDEKTLGKMLRDAEKAHGVYEKKLGRRDSLWSHWYATFIIKQLQEKKLARKNK